jgi:hypothetical protein
MYRQGSGVCGRRVVRDSRGERELRDIASKRGSRQSREIHKMRGVGDGSGKREMRDTCVIGGMRKAFRTRAVREPGDIRERREMREVRIVESTRTTSARRGAPGMRCRRHLSSLRTMAPTRASANASSPHQIATACLNPLPRSSRWTRIVVIDKRLRRSLGCAARAGLYGPLRRYETSGSCSHSPLANGPRRGGQGAVVMLDYQSDDARRPTPAPTAVVEECAYPR